MKRAPQFAIVGILHHGKVAGHPKRKLPSRASIALGLRARFSLHVVGNAGELPVVLDIKRPAVRRIEQMLFELRTQLRDLFLNCFEARFLVIGQLRAAQTKVAELVVDHAALRGVEGRKLGRRLQRAILAEQSLVLAEVCVKRGDLRQIRMKCVAERRRIDHGVQVPDGAPHAVEAVQAFGERRDHARPSCRMTVGRDRFDRCARLREPLVDRRRHVRRQDGVEARQAGEFEQRVRGGRQHFIARSR